MDADEVRRLVARLGEEDAAVDRYRDALSDRLHEIHPRIPAGETPPLDELFAGEIRRLAEEIRPHLETLDAIRRTEALRDILLESLEPPTTDPNSDMGRRIYRQVQWLDERLVELGDRRRTEEGLELGAVDLVLQRLAELTLAQLWIERHPTGSA